ncbi:hypothetical protein BDW72DRAFT_15749 [Aspergillus terricola var. indicus]
MSTNSGFQLIACFGLMIPGHNIKLSESHIVGQSSVQELAVGLYIYGFVDRSTSHLQRPVRTSKVSAD